MSSAIKTISLVGGYDKITIIPDFNIEIKEHKITSIIGSNGCGKSTILKTMGRILPSLGGDIFLNEQNIKEKKNKEIAKKLAILPQSPTAPGTLTVRELVGYGRFPYKKGFGFLNDEDKEIVDWALKVTSTDTFADRSISNLSGGQRQRVWIAMALAQKTDIIFLDEPTTYLDLAHQLDVLELLKKLNGEEHCTIVMVLHDLNLASKYSDYLIAMKDGKIYRNGTVEEVMKEDMLKDCFGIEGIIEKDQYSSKPICVSYRLFKNEE